MFDEFSTGSGLESRAGNRRVMTYRAGLFDACELKTSRSQTDGRSIRNRPL